MGILPAVVKVGEEPSTMTPTLLGRWQTRLLLFQTVGLFVTLLFTEGLIGPGGGVFFWVLEYLFLFGLGWDVVYNYLQKFRWDRDWPGALQLAAGVWEAFFILLVIGFFGLPGIFFLDLGWFLVHYSLVWLAIYTASQTIMRILFPRWRFRGGEWL